MIILLLYAFLSCWSGDNYLKEVPAFVEQLIYLDIPAAGIHKISFSMREDGFEFDKWILSQKYQVPSGIGPAESPVITVEQP